MCRTTGAASNATTTDSSGHYRFEGLPGGDYLLRAAAPGFAPFLADDVHVADALGDARHRACDRRRARANCCHGFGNAAAPEHVSKVTTVIDQSDADARDAASLSDVVALAPGVRVQQLGGPGAFTTIQIRGMHDQDTALLVDGLDCETRPARKATPQD